MLVVTLQGEVEFSVPLFFLSSFAGAQLEELDGVQIPFISNLEVFSVQTSVLQHVGDIISAWRIVQLGSS